MTHGAGCKGSRVCACVSLCVCVCVCVKMSVSCTRGQLRRDVGGAAQLLFFSTYMAQYGVSSVCRGPTVNSVYDAQKQHLQKGKRGTNTDREEGGDREREIKAEAGDHILGQLSG